MQILKSRSLIDFYMFFPYKRNAVFTGTIPVPYIKKEEESDHKYSMTYKEWKLIIMSILQEIKEELLDTKTWVIGSHIGEISLRKKRCKTFTDYKLSKEKGSKVSRIRNDYDNYMIFGEWERKTYPLPFKWLWRFKMLRAFKLNVYKLTDKDYTFLFKFLDK